MKSLGSCLIVEYEVRERNGCAAKAVSYRRGRLALLSNQMFLWMLAPRLYHILVTSLAPNRCHTVGDR